MTKKQREALKAQQAPTANAGTLHIETGANVPAITPDVVTVTPSEKVNHLTFTVYQTGVSFEIKTPIKDESAQQVIGNVAQSLFRWVSLQRAFKAKGLNFSQPLGLRFNVGGNLWDTGNMEMTFTERLKLQDTPHSRVSFAQKLYALYLHSTYQPETVAYDDYMNVLRAAVPPPVKRLSNPEKAA